MKKTSTTSLALLMILSVLLVVALDRASSSQERGEEGPLSAVEFIVLSAHDNSLHGFSTSSMKSSVIGKLHLEGDLWSLVKGPSELVRIVDRDANRLITVNQVDGTVVGWAGLDKDMFVSRRGLAVSPGDVPNPVESLK